MTDRIRRNRNGSIDTAHFVTHCHRQRSLAAHRACRRAWAALRGGWSRVARMAAGKFAKTVTWATATVPGA